MKKILNLLLIGTFFIELSCTYAQKEDYKWLLGYESNFIDSTFGGAVINFNGKIAKVNYEYRKTDFYKTNAAISDSVGNLLFYTNGCYIADKTHEPMQNGTGLSLGNLYNNQCTGSGLGVVLAQGAVVLNAPDSSNIYYLIHQRIVHAPVGYVYLDSIFYTKIDMNKNNGLGAVVEKNVAIPIPDTIFGGLTAVRHSDGKSWWIMSATRNLNRYWSILVNSTGVSVVSSQEIGTATQINGAGSGQSNYSPDGTKYAIYNYKNQVLLFDMDRDIGQLSNFRQLTIDTPAVGGCIFSPNSRFLYITANWYIYQFDTWATDVQASKQVVAKYDGYKESNYFVANFWLAQLGPDCKIYICSTSSVRHLHVINHPDRAGLACDVQQHSFALPTWNSASLPNFPNYRLGTTPTYPCDSMITATTIPWIAGNNYVLNLYPNPTTDLLHIAYHTENTTALTVAISDYTGKKIQTLSLDSASGSLDINTSALPNGLYLCTLYDSATHRQQSVKFVVMR